MREKNATPDLAAARIAARQHGVVSTRQLLATGMSRSGISRRTRSGRLHRVHTGVYAVGHPGLGDEGRWMAAVLAYPGPGKDLSRPGKDLSVGEAAVLSHRSAAALWGMLKPASGDADVTVAGDGGRARRRGIRLHRSRTLALEATTRRSGIPVTTPARTVADLRPIVSAGELRSAVRQAAVLGLSLGPAAPEDRTRSELEYLFLRLCRRHRLPMPEVNVRAGPVIVDFLWPEQRLIVETDGYRYHRGAAAFEGDRARDLALRVLGYEVIRLSFRQVSAEPERIAAALRRALAVSSATSQVRRHRAP